MADDPPESTPPSPDSGRAKRAGPTIDLEATEVPGESQPAGAGAEPGRPSGRTSGAAISAAIVAMISGAVTAALVIAVAWYLGWPTEALVPAPPPASSAGIDALASRVAEIEAKESNEQSTKQSSQEASQPASLPAAPDPALAERLATLEQSLGALRGEVTAARAQSEKLAAEVGELKSAPHETAAIPDLAAINDRLAQLERTDRAQSAEIAQGNAKPADDVALRRIVAAALLDIMVRTGEPYAAALAAARALAPDPQALKPLDEFADSGVPTPAAMSRDLLTLVPKLQPPAPGNAPTTGSGLVDRLEAGATRLVRIERTDAVGNDRGAVVARITAAALRNDSNEARRELNTLAPADRAAAQAWLDRSEARDAALAASRAFAAEAMAALAKPAP